MFGRKPKIGEESSCETAAKGKDVVLLLKLPEASCISENGCVEGDYDV